MSVRDGVQPLPQNGRAQRRVTRFLSPVSFVVPPVARANDSPADSNKVNTTVNSVAVLVWLVGQSRNQVATGQIICSVEPLRDPHGSLFVPECNWPTGPPRSEMLLLQRKSHVHAGLHRQHAGKRAGGQIGCVQRKQRRLAHRKGS
jgi:hypothetical protein